MLTLSAYILAYTTIERPSRIHSATKKVFRWRLAQLLNRASVYGDCSLGMGVKKTSAVISYVF